MVSFALHPGRIHRIQVSTEKRFRKLWKAFRKETAAGFPVSRTKILGIFHEHPILLVIRCLVVIFLASFLLLVLSFLVPGVFSAEYFFWVTITVGVITLAILSRFYIGWTFSTDCVTEKQIIRLEYRGVFGHAIDRCLLDQVKSFDLDQQGFLQTIFDFGNIYVGLLGSEKEIALRNIWPARRAFYIIKTTVNQLQISELLEK